MLLTDSLGEVHDGTIADMAFPSDPGPQADQARGWIAQGRVRAALRLSDGLRMPDEDRCFAAAAGQLELLAAVEIDEPRNQLYTLSDRALYREDLAGACAGADCSVPFCSPAHPGNLTQFDFAPGASTPLEPPLLPDEALLDVKLVPQASGTGLPAQVLVLTSYRLMLLASGPSGFELEGQCLELYERQSVGGAHSLESPTDEHFNSFQVDRFVSARVSIDHTGRTIAYLLANEGCYANLAHGPTPLLLLCDLNAGESFAHPTLHADAAHAEFVYWSPFDAQPPFEGGDATGVHEHAARQLAVRVGPAQTEVFVACGRQKQLRRLGAVFASGGVREHETITLDAGQDLEVVQVALDSAERLFVRGTQSLFDVELSPSGTSWTRLDDHAFPKGAVGDAAQVLLGSEGEQARTLWTMGAGALGYNVQSFDVALHGPSDYWDLDYIWRCDGGVALDFGNAYVLTGGGVRHYRLQGGRWEQRRYRPTFDAGGALGQGFCEQLELARVAEGEPHLLGPSNTGAASGLFDWPLDADHEPQAGRLYPIAANEVFPGFTAGDALYTDDIACIAEGGELYALLCPTRLPGGPGSAREAALVVYRWHAGTWTQIASAHAPLATGFANTIALAELDSGGQVAFVATDAGVLSFALRELATGRPTVALASILPGEATNGVVATGARLIVACTHAPDPRYLLFDWDRSTGAIRASGSKTISTAQLGVPAGYGRTFRLRFDPTAAPDGFVYDCNEAGQVVRLRYRAGAEETLEFDAQWRSLDRNVIQDCRVYTFGGVKKLLVTKDREAFAWVDP